MIKKTNKIILSSLFLLAQVGIMTAYGQQIKAELKGIGNQYQTIQIPQEFRAIIGNDVSKVRIKDKNGNEIPYILENNQGSYQTFEPTAFNRINTDSTETLVIENKGKKKLSHYVLKIGNSTASKSYSIEGSQNGKEWFSLVSAASLSDLQDSEETYVVKSLEFPLNDYAFIRIIINNKKSAPINVLDIGQFKITNLEAHYEKLKRINYHIEQNKKEKTTTVKITKEGIIPINYISFHIPSPTLFSREAMLYAEEEVTIKKRKSITEIGMYYFDLQNNVARNIEIPDFAYPNTIFIKLQNKDNQPLQIDSISLYQIPLYIVAQLDQNQSYTLEADNEWKTPDYDINKLQLNLPKDLPKATISNISAQSKDQEKTENKSNGKLILIIGSIIGAIVVFYFGNSLIKDMKKNND